MPASAQGRRAAVDKAAMPTHAADTPTLAHTAGHAGAWPATAALQHAKGKPGTGAMMRGVFCPR